MDRKDVTYIATIVQTNPSNRDVTYNQPAKQPGADTKPIVLLAESKCNQHQLKTNADLKTGAYTKPVGCC
jgi:hypothetical protein